MIKFGDKVKFSKYINIDYLGCRRFDNFISPKKHTQRKLRGNLMYTREKKDDIVTIKERVFEDNILEGIYLRDIKRKLKRQYRIDTSPTTFDQQIVDSSYHRPDRPTTSRFRLDDPRQLERLAVVMYKSKILVVPKTNIYELNCKDYVTIL